MEYTAYRARRHFPALDGLRALCILGVISTHMHDHLWWWLAGNLGVVVFFVLSGYLITTLALREEERDGRVHLRAFFVRRVFRLFPAYYLVLALYALLILGFGFTPEKRAPFVAAIPYYLTYSVDIPYLRTASLGYGEAIQPFFHAWSLGIEEKFYLLWPIVAFVVLANHKRLRLPLTVGGILLCTVAPFIAHGGVFIAPYTGILAGCAAGLVLHDPWTYRRFDVLGTRVGVVIAGLAVLACELVTPYSPIARIIFPLPTAIMVIALVRSETSGFGRFLSSRALVRLGELSYGVYLIHRIALNAAERAVPHFISPSLGRWPVGIATLLATTLLATLMAAVLSRTVEEPLRAHGRRIAARLVADRPVVEAQAAAA